MLESIKTNTVYPIILEWKFSYKKKLIELTENCEKNYKQTCSKEKIANVSSVRVVKGGTKSQFPA